MRNVISIIGILIGLVTSIFGASSLTKINWSSVELPVELILITAFGLFLALFSFSFVRPILK